MSWPPTYQGQGSPNAPMPGYATSQSVPSAGHPAAQSQEAGAAAASAGTVESAAGSNATVGQSMVAGTGGAQATAAGEFGVPRADVYEAPESYLVELEMPGFEKQDISVYADENRLIVSGERAVEDATDRRVVQRERPIQLERTLQLPVTVDVEETTATYEAGVCAIEVPKGEAEDRNRIGFQ